MPPVVVALLLAAAPTLDVHYVMEVAGVPMAELHLVHDGARYRYESVRFFEERSPPPLELELARGAPRFEALTLVERGESGCRVVLEERSRKQETLCLDASRGPTTKGTLSGAGFTARYATDGILEALDLQGAHWRRVEGPTERPTENPFTRGVAAVAGASVLAPTMEGVTLTEVTPRGIGEDEDRRRCLVLAREALVGHPARNLVLGLVLEGGRAYPHAWVDEQGVALDPSVPAGDAVLHERRYLALPTERAGSVYLELFSGRRRLARP